MFWVISELIEKPLMANQREADASAFSLIRFQFFNVILYEQIVINM